MMKLNYNPGQGPHKGCDGNDIYFDQRLLQTVLVPPTRTGFARYIEGAACCMRGARILT